MRSRLGSWKAFSALMILSMSSCTWQCVLRYAFSQSKCIFTALRPFILFVVYP